MLDVVILPVSICVVPVTDKTLILLNVLVLGLEALPKIALPVIVKLLLAPATLPNVVTVDPVKLAFAARFSTPLYV